MYGTRHYHELRKALSHARTLSVGNHGRSERWREDRNHKGWQTDVHCALVHLHSVVQGWTTQMIDAWEMLDWRAVRSAGWWKRCAVQAARRLRAGT